MLILPKEAASSSFFLILFLPISSFSPFWLAHELIFLPSNSVESRRFIYFSDLCKKNKPLSSSVFHTIFEVVHDLVSQPRRTRRESFREEMFFMTVGLHSVVLPCLPYLCLGKKSTDLRRQLFFSFSRNVDGDGNSVTSDISDRFIGHPPKVRANVYWRRTMCHAYC